MKELVQSVVARVAGGWQFAGAKFDFEVFALPGGSLIAVVLWLYSLVTVMSRTGRPRAVAKNPRLDACTDAARSATFLSSSCCARHRAHCS